MRCQEIHIIFLICSQALYTGFMDNCVNSVLPSIIKNHEKELNNTFNSTIVSNYINNIMSLLTTIKCLARVIIAPFSGLLINKFGPMYTLLCGIFFQFISIIILFFARINILIHSIVRVFDGISIPLANGGSVNLAWITFFDKGNHPIIISFAFILGLVGIVISPYIAGNLNKSFGFIYIPVYMICHISLTISLWISVYVNLKRYPKKSIVIEIAVTDETSYKNNNIENSVDVSDIKTDDDNIKNNKNDNNKNNPEKLNTINLCQIFMFYRLMGDPHVFILCLNLFMFNFIMACMMCTLPLWIIETYHVNEAKAGSVWIYTGVVAVITNIICIFLFHKHSHQRYLASLIGLLSIGTGIIILPFYPIYWAVAFTIGIVFWGGSVVFYTSIPMILEVVKIKFGQDLTTYASVLPSNSNALGYLFGGFIAGPLVNLVGFRTHFVSFGVLNIALSFLNLFLKRYS